MDSKLFTALEVAVIGGLIVAVMYFGGLFDSKPVPTLFAPTATLAVVADLPSPTATVTPRPTHIPRPTVEPSLTPTTPPLTQPTGLIAFETTRDGNAEIYTIQADGSGEKNLTNNPAEDYNFTWSPDGERIAFFSTRTGWLEVFAMNADGSNVVQVTHLEGQNIIYNPPLAWSPDGNYLLAIQTPAWVAPHTEVTKSLNLIRADGSGTAITLYQIKNGYIWQPRWSPDNKYLSLAIQDNQICHHYIADAANLSQTPIEFREFTPDCSAFSWSPDGRQIAYSAGLIHIAASDTGQEQFTIQTPHNTNNFTSWSPDGQNILYSDSSGKLNLISIDGVRRVALNFYQYDPPSWSPDGQWLAILDPRQLDVSLLNIYDPGNLILLTHTNNNFAPQWQP